MIKNILHKGLRLFYENGDASKLPPEHRGKILRILRMLRAVTNEKDIKALGLNVHQLKGNLKNRWSVSVTANYRITF